MLRFGIAALWGILFLPWAELPSTKSLVRSRLTSLHVSPDAGRQTSHSCMLHVYRLEIYAEAGARSQRLGTEFLYFCLLLTNVNELLLTPFHVSDDWSGFAARVLLEGQKPDWGSQKRQWHLLRRLQGRIGYFILILIAACGR